MAKDTNSTENTPVVTKSKENTYKANPTQYVYDQIHQQGFVINVVDIFFAQEIKKEEWIQGADSYTVKGGGTIKNILDKYKKERRKNIKTDPERKLTEVVKKDEVIKIVWEEVQDKIEFKKINQVELGEEIYLIAQCYGQTGKLKITLKEEFSSSFSIFNDPVVFLVNGEEKKVIEFNIHQLVKAYSQKIKICPKNDAKFKEINKKLKGTDGKKINIYLIAEITDTQDQVNWNLHYPNYDFIKNCYSVNYLTGVNEKFSVTDKKPVIVTDAGHGINGDGGNVYSSNPDIESIMTLLLETETTNKLTERGFNAKRTRTTDSLKVNEKQVIYRINFAKKEKAQIFISFHLDYVPLNKDNTINQKGAESTNKIGINLHPKVLKNEAGNTINGGASDKFYNNSSKLIDCLIPELQKIFTDRKIVKINATRPNVSHDYIGVLKGMEGSDNAATLIEFGNTTFENTEFLRTNSEKIGEAMAIGIETYINSI